MEGDAAPIHAEVLLLERRTATGRDQLTQPALVQIAVVGRGLAPAKAARVERLARVSHQVEEGVVRLPHRLPITEGDSDHFRAEEGPESRLALPAASFRALPCAAGDADPSAQRHKEHRQQKVPRRRGRNGRRRQSGESHHEADQHGREQTRTKTADPGACQNCRHEQQGDGWRRDGPRRDAHQERKRIRQDREAVSREPGTVPHGGRRIR